MDTQFIEQPHGQGHEHQREDIRRGGDDGAKYKQEHYDMAAVLLHHTGIDYPQSAHYPAYNGYLENQAHAQAYGYKRIQIGGYGYGVLYGLAYLVRAQKTERERENEKVGKQDAKEKHEETAHRQPLGIALFPMIQRWRNEAEQLVKDIWRGDHKPYIQ